MGDQISLISLLQLIRPEDTSRQRGEYSANQEAEKQRIATNQALRMRRPKQAHDEVAEKDGKSPESDDLEDQPCHCNFLPIRVVARGRGGHAASHTL